MNTLLQQGVPKFVYHFFYEGEEYEREKQTEINEKIIFQTNIRASRMFSILNIFDLRVSLL